MILVPSPAAAEDARELLHSGIELFNRARFQDSLATLKRAAGQPQDLRHRGRVRLYMGLCHAVLGDRAAARAAFSRALHADPELVLDARRMKRQIVELFEQVRADVKGRLVVTAGGPGARVFVDGRELGPAPLEQQLPVGRHRLLVLGPAGQQLHHAWIVIRAGSGTSFGVQLTGTPTPQRRRIWTWVAAGGAVVALGLGFGLWAWAEADHQEFLSTPDPARYDQLKQQIQARDTGAGVMFGVAGALTAASAILFYLEGRRSTEERRHRALVPVLQLSPAGVGIRVDLP